MSGKESPATEDDHPSCQEQRSQTIVAAGTRHQRPIAIAITALIL
jgi:hypothetical protein